MTNDLIPSKEQLDFEAHLQNLWIQGVKPRKRESYQVYDERLSGAGNTGGDDFGM